MELGELSAQFQARGLQACPLHADVLLALVPRRKDRVFDGAVFLDATTEAAIPPERIRQRLPRWRRALAGGFPLDGLRRIKGIEHRLHLDAATQVGDEWLAQRAVTVLCLHRRPGGKYVPATGVAVTFTRVPAESALQFLAAGGGRSAQITVRTDGAGLAEVRIVHPTAAVPADRRRVRIAADATVALLGPDGRSTSTQTVQVRTELELELVRNEAAARPQEVFDRPDDEKSADRIWLFQPANPDPRSEGIRELQEALNEVVPRHRAVQVQADGLVPRTGVYDEPTRVALDRFLQHFPGIHAGNDYPYELKDIGPDPDLLTYLQEEYAPFDPTTAANRGKVVDRRLLIGKVLDTTPARIDGLWELYEGVVKVLRDQVRAYAQSYLDCDLVWLHRPNQGPNAPAADRVFACRANGVVLRAAPQASSPAVQVGGAQVALSDGDHTLVVAQAPQGGWLRVRTAGGVEGWVAEGPATGQAFRNDAGRYRTPDNAGDQVRNLGNHGPAGVGWGQDHYANGVAYTYGGKQTPEQWRQTLLTNPHAAPDRIVHYDQYQHGHRFGSVGGEANAAAYLEAGCDCSGLIQNCVTYSLFPGTTTRIVPVGMVSAVGPLTCIAAAAWVGGLQAPTRRIAIHPTDPDRHWVRGGDIVNNGGHVVMIAEDVPNMASADTFTIMHEYGVFTSADLTRFRRKSIRSRFRLWGTNLNAFQFGKVHIWR